MQGVARRRRGCSRSLRVGGGSAFRLVHTQSALLRVTSSIVSERLRVVAAVRPELEPEGICEAVRRRANELLSNEGVEHCTIQCVPMLQLHMQTRCCL